MYARGMTVREVRAHPLETCYRLIFFDAIRVKIRDEDFVRNKAVYIALGIQPDGTKEVLGFWIEQTEGAKFWMRGMTELKNRSIADILIAVVDGLKGFPDAITAVFPKAVVQTYIVHRRSDTVADRAKARKASEVAGDFRRRSGPRYPGDLRQTDRSNDPCVAGLGRSAVPQNLTPMPTWNASTSLLINGVSPFR